MSGKPLADYNYQERKSSVQSKKAVTDSEIQSIKTKNMETEKKSSIESQDPVSEEQTDRGISEGLANLSIDKGIQESGEEQTRAKPQQENKLKLKKTSQSDSKQKEEKYRNLSSTSESESIDSFDSPHSKNTSVSLTSDSDLDKSPLNTASKSESELNLGKGDKKTPDHRHKYEGIGRIKKKSPQTGSQTDSSPELPLLQRIRIKSGEQEGSSPKSPVEIVDLTSDDEGENPRVVAGTTNRVTSPEDKQTRYQPPAHTLPTSQDLHSANQIQANKSIQPLTGAEEWQLQSDIDSRNALLQQLNRQKVDTQVAGNH